MYDQLLKQAGLIDSLKGLSKAEILEFLKSKEAIIAALGFGTGVAGGVMGDELFSGDDDGGLFDDMGDMFGFAASDIDLLKQAGLGSLLQRPFSVGGGELASLLSKQIHLPGFLGAGTRNAASAKAAEALKVILQGKQEAAQAAAMKALAYGVPAGIGAGALGAYGLGELLGEDEGMFSFGSSENDLIKQAEAELVAQAILSESAQTQQAQTDAHAQTLQALVALASQEEAAEMGGMGQEGEIPPEVMEQLMAAQGQMPQAAPAQGEIPPEVMEQLMAAQGQAAPVAPVAPVAPETVEQKVASAYSDLISRIS